MLLGAWAQIAIGLRPLRHLTARVAAIKAGRESRLEAPLPLEVEPLAREFNSLLDRQAESVRRSRERVGALAHGLKTPITILYGKADALDEEGLSDYAAGLRAQLGVMNKHVTRELTRARSHGAATGGELHTNARLSVGRLFGLLLRMPRGRDLSFVNAIPDGLILAIDADDFGEIMGNLLDNARKFAKDRIVVSAVVEADRATIFVADDGPGVPAEIRERLMQRGERASEQVEGSGLGLSIVQDLLADYRTTVVFENCPEFGCKVGFALTGRLDAPAAAKRFGLPTQA
ncbi:MAG: HAMP domain-containing histidine kinase [Pseudomonadota bacterium]|nr:HAMP domain-containing histidine kinase [Pseudomonadota bacterium]